MNNNTAIPHIEFGEGTDYDSLYSLLFCANKGLGFQGSSSGITYEFHLSDGRTITGSYAEDSVEGDTDYMHIAQTFGGVVKIRTDLIERIVYL